MHFIVPVACCTTYFPFLFCRNAAVQVSARRSAVGDNESLWNSLESHRGVRVSVHQLSGSQRGTGEYLALFAACSYGWIYDDFLNVISIRAVRAWLWASPASA